MNFIKTTMIILSATFMLWGCSDDDESTNGENSSISLSTNIIQTDKSETEATVTVTSSGDWRLSGVCDWAQPSITSGKDGDVVTFSIKPNTLDEKRTATFKFFTGSSVAPLEIESAPAYVMNLLSDDNISLSKEKNTVQIQLSTNISDPTITYSDGSEEWLTFDRRSDFAGKSTFIFNVTANESYKERNTTITIASPLVAEPVKVNLAQKQTDAIIIDENLLMYDLAARTISFKLKYNVEYTSSVAIGSDWITEQPTAEPQVGEDGLSTTTLTYKLPAASITRGGRIVISKTDKTITKNIIVIQKDPEVDLPEIPDASLRSIAMTNNWILPIKGNQCVILEAGLNATSLANSAYANPISDLSGIENFPNLAVLSLGYCTNMRKLDISGLHKVMALSFSNTKNCEVFNLGDNPILSFDAGGTYAYSNVTSLKIISSKVEVIDLSLFSSFSRYDYVTSIDVSECPALRSLNADRSNKVTTLYLNEGQNITSLTKNEVTTIVYK